MSLAVPASYNEYYYTSQNDGLICDGGIMPLRNGAADSTWYRNCLRAEDLMFLNEANNIRGRCCRQSYGVPTPTKYIQASKLNSIRDNIGYLWTYGGPTAPSLQAHVFDANTLLDDNNVGVDEYIQSCFASKTRYSGSDTYTTLRADQIMNFYKDIKQLNYFYRQGGSRGSAVPYTIYQRGCRTERTYSDGSDPDYFDYSYHICYNTIYYKYDNSQLVSHWDENTISNYMTFQLYSSGDMIPKTLIDLSIWIGCYVYNYAGKHNSYSEYGDVTDVTKYVLVPLKSQYQNMTNVTVPEVTSSELNSAANAAFSAAGLEKNPLSIPCGEPPQSSWDIVHHNATAYCELWDIYYFSHVRYCSLENVAVN